MSPRSLAFGLVTALWLGSTVAQQQTNSVNGLSGYVFVPSAGIGDKGSVSVDYSPSVLGTDRLGGHNLTLLFGLTSFAEVSGRVAANTLQCRMYSDPNCGMRDLSASGKIGFDLGWLSSAPVFKQLRVALGATDVGGAATSFYSNFVVASYLGSRWELSGGFAKGRENLSQHMPLDGPFVGGSISIAPWLKMHAEATAENRVVGLSLFDDSLLSQIGFPQGSRLHLQVNRALGPSRDIPETHLAFGLRIPLDSTLRPYSSTFLARQTRQDAQPQIVPLPKPTQYRVEASSEQPDETRAQPDGSRAIDTLQQAASSLADVLAKEGFSDIAIGYSTDGGKVVLSVNNMGYTHSELDALGAALGNLAFSSAGRTERYRLVLRRWNVPIVWVEGDIQCLRGWLLREARCPEANALLIRFQEPSETVPPKHSQDTATRKPSDAPGTDRPVIWLIKGFRPAWEKLRLHLGPSSHYAFATEYGIWDYSVGAVINPWLHLWQGAILEGIRQVHIAHSRDYDTGGIFSFWRTQTANGRLMLHQAFSLPSVLPSPIGGIVSGRISVGRPFEDWLGGGGELRWDSSNGEHALTLASHRYLYQGDLSGYRPGQPSSLSYRWLPTNTDWQLEATYGRWWNRDNSVGLASRHWFGDVNLGFFIQQYKDARPLWFGGREVAFAGIELSFPLSLRREIHTGSLPFDLRGLPRYAVGLATTVGRKDNAFVGAGGYPLYAHLGVGSGIPFATGAILRDFDRLGPAYTPFHLDRLQYAFDRWVKPRLSAADLIVD